VSEHQHRFFVHDCESCEVDLPFRGMEQKVVDMRVGCFPKDNDIMSENKKIRIAIILDTNHTYICMLSYLNKINQDHKGHEF
jgi:hypothetical protein